MYIKHQSPENKMEGLMLLFALTIQRLKKPSGIAVVSETPLFINATVQGGKILERSNLVIIITPVIAKFQNQFNQNHLDVNENLGAKVINSVVNISSFKRNANKLKE